MKYLQYLYLVIIICASPIFIHSQNNEQLDSLLGVYQTQAEDTLKLRTLKVLFDSYLYNDLAQAEKYAREELHLATKLNFKRGIGLANLHLGVLYNNKAQLDSAKVKYLLAENIFDEIGAYRNKAVAIRNLAIIEYNLSNYDEALILLDKGIEVLKSNTKDTISLIPFYQNKATIHHFKGNYQIAAQEIIKALNILDSLDRPIQKADALNVLAMVESSQRQHQKAINYNKEAATIYKEFNDKAYASGALNDIGLDYYYLKDYNNAITYLQEALPLARAVKAFNLETSILTNLGKSQVAINEIDKGIALLKEGLQIAEDIKAKNKTAESLNELAKAYSKKNEPQTSVYYSNRSIEISKETNAKSTLADAYLNRATAFAQANNYKQAYNDHQVFKQLSDSVYNNRRSQQIEELKTIYETEKKAQQIVQLETEVELLEQKEKVSTLQKTLLGVGLGLSLLVFGVGYYAIRQKMEKSRIEKEKVTEALAFKQKELTTHALNLARKNEVLKSLKQKAQTLKVAENIGKGYQQLIRTINFDLQDDNNWENFSKYFQEVHKDFTKNAKQKYPTVTHNELRLMSLLKMNLSSKEVANILNISIHGIKKARQRLRKKMGLATKDSLEDAIFNI